MSRRLYFARHFRFGSVRRRGTGAATRRFARTRSEPGDNRGWSDSRERGRGGGDTSIRGRRRERSRIGAGGQGREQSQELYRQCKVFRISADASANTAAATSPRP